MFLAALWPRTVTSTSSTATATCYSAALCGELISLGRTHETHITH